MSAATGLSSPMNDQQAPAPAATLLEDALTERFGASLSVDPNLPGLDELLRIAAHRVHRRFLPRAVEPGLLRLLCACALSAPSKSDLQQDWPAGKYDRVHCVGADAVTGVGAPLGVLR